jgi:hypothetical protein
MVNSYIDTSAQNLIMGYGIFIIKFSTLQELWSLAYQAV